ncbi:DUF2255 family protein [Endozoicomonas sp. G2_1]|uniref:DUF2255 family protein n=1 Tax=Endozoicomonas sp. G2_1 TaxID=2821091 RepID=UPI001ADA2C4D|nr:DUF2255 family protein [Endozoicomonas sp. G2_1]MBO9489089.1 DUF2255 family protein [Endozoicomonas sp. G2_1]
MTTIEQVSALINAYQVHQIRAGKNHRFVDISIVEVDGRFFVRQYKFGENSWYHAFIKTPLGQIKCGDTTIDIKGQVPSDLSTINAMVTKSFWKKYSIIYGIMKLGFNTKKHEASTLELIPLC